MSTSGPSNRTDSILCVITVSISTLDSEVQMIKANKRKLSIGWRDSIHVYQGLLGDHQGTINVEEIP